MRPRPTPTSIHDLPADAGQLGNRIVGIEPGAGLPKITKETVMRDYGLDADHKLVLASTTAMLAELKKAFGDPESPASTTVGSTTTSSRSRC